MAEAEERTTLLAPGEVAWSMGFKFSTERTLRSQSSPNSDYGLQSSGAITEPDVTLASVSSDAR